MRDIRIGRRGIPALTTYFSVTTAIPNAITTYQIDFEGNGIIGYSGTTFDDVRYRYTTAGIYYPTVTITDDQGNHYTDTTAITVLNKTEIDALLKSKWEGMKAALLSSNVENALMYFVGESKEQYRQAFNFVLSSISSIVNPMQNIELVYLKDAVAKYRIRRVQIIEGSSQEITYYIYFVKDNDGIWKIEKF